jgi:hypothetical protein
LLAVVVFPEEKIQGNVTTNCKGQSNLDSSNRTN